MKKQYTPDFESSSMLKTI